MRRVYLMAMGVLFLFSLADADLIIEFQAADSISRLLPEEARGTYFIKGDKCRFEALSSISIPMGGRQELSFEINSVAVTRLDSGIIWLILPENEFIELSTSSLKLPDTPYVLNEYSWEINVVPFEKTRKIKKLVCNGRIGNAIGVNKDDPEDTVFVTFEKWQSEDTLFSVEFDAYQDRYTNETGRHRIWAQKHIANYLQGPFGPIIEILSDSIGMDNSIPMKYAVAVERTVKYEETTYYVVANAGQKTPISRRGKGIHPDGGGYWKLILFTSEVTNIKQKVIDNHKFELPKNCKRKVKDAE